MLKDIVESFRVNWLSRLASPLFAALAISWTIWNHRLLITLFTNQKLQWRFAYIDDVLYPTIWHHLIFQAALPIVTAAFYLYVFPIPARGVFRYTLKRKVELNNLAKEIEGQRLLTQEDAKALREQMAQVEADRATQEEDFKKQIEVFRGANSKLSLQIADTQRSLYLARAEGISVRPDQAKRRIEDYILSRPFLLIFNMKIDREKGSKSMVFSEGGVITMGGNQNENTWIVTSEGKLQFINSSGVMHSEFKFNPIKGNFDGKVPSESRDQVLSPSHESKPQ
ncbi:MAG: hypothetical protein HOQ32_08850 [Lysobacter sp.]|nr:hypothetical protein [Lysobacter sp.]